MKRAWLGFLLYPCLQCLYYLKWGAHKYWLLGPAWPIPSDQLVLHRSDLKIPKTNCKSRASTHANFGSWGLYEEPQVYVTSSGNPPSLPSFFAHTPPPCGHLLPSPSLPSLLHAPACKFSFPPQLLFSLAHSYPPPAPPATTARQSRLCTPSVLTPWQKGSTLVALCVCVCTRACTCLNFQILGPKVFPLTIPTVFCRDNHSLSSTLLCHIII